jgi:hypothetical protein
VNGVSRIDFDPVKLSYLKDEIHFILDETEDYGVTSLVAFKNIWFVSLKNKECIFDLSHDRVVFSDTVTPNSLFFNSMERLCFVEESMGKVHCGDDIFYFNKNVWCFMEDENKDGYWLVVGKSIYYNLVFMDYDGDVKDKIDIGKYGYGFNNIIEAKGNLV